MFYRLRFRFYIWWNVPAMTLAQAINYPCDPSYDGATGDPIEDARSEMSYMAE